jgi:GR25 family glycosyltransferase involved in LPS biosynthesis
MAAATILPVLKCKNCNKKYYRQNAFNKHKLFCVEGNNETPLLDAIDETKIEDIFKKRSSDDLEKIIIELIKSNNQLKKDVKELKKWAQIKKKKINILEWLNNDSAKPDEYYPKINYKEFISNIEITRKDLEEIFNTDLFIGIEEILEKYIKEVSINASIPLKSFNQKDNTIYVYTENAKWELLSHDDFNKLIFPITKKILKEFSNWKKDNDEKLYTEEFSSIVIQNTKKVIGGDISIEKQQNKIYKNLYKYLKKDLQNTIEYEFL